MIELFFYVIVGVFLGVFSGLMPGIHLNTISFFVASFAVQNNFNIAVLIVSMSVMHSFVDFIPSILLGASDNEGNFLSVLPGHKMFLQGKALEAVKLSAFGCLLGVFFAIVFSPVFVSFAFQISFFLPKVLVFLLAFVLLLMVFSEKTFWKKACAITVVFLSGILGVVSLNYGSMQNSLLALVSGFFAASTLIWSVKQKTVFVEQNNFEVKFDKKPSLLSGFFGSIAGSIVALLPSIGPSEAAFLLNKLIGEISTKSYLVLLGSISTANMVFSFFMLYYFNKTRTGSAVAVKQIIQLSQNQFFILLAVALFTAGIAFFLSVWFSKKSIFFLEKINYSLLNIVVLVFLSLIVFAFSGFLGLLVFFTASSIGIFSLSTGVKRSHSMAFLMLPTMLFYFNALISSL